MIFKIKRLLFILKGKTIGWSPSGDFENYKKYILKEKNMKVIDLLNKIANGEELPDKIFYDGSDYKLVEYGETTKLYQCLSEPYELININTDRLNEKVEIIEEDKKLEKLKNINCEHCIEDCYYETLTKEEIALDISTLKKWVNKIIDYLEEKE